MNKVQQTKAVNPLLESIKPRRKYDRSFKKEAVALWLNSGKSARQIASELGISEGRLYSWHSEFSPSPAQEADLENQLQVLRRENVELRQQRDILKKTLGILSEPPSNGISG